MPILLERVYQNPTPSGAPAGTWEYSTLTEFSGKRMCPRILRQIMVKSTSNDTTFDVLIYDYEDVQIRRFITCTFISNDLTPTPIVGPVKIRLENVSKDEPFDVLMMFSDT
jgi:hypothetical protein